MPRIYYMPRTRSNRVLWALNEIGAPFDSTPVEREDRRSPEHLARHPLGRVPAFELDDGTVMFESAAILLQLGDLYPESGLLPAPGSSERALVYQWTMFGMTELEGPLYRWLGERREGIEQTAGCGALQRCRRGDRRRARGAGMAAGRSLHRRRHRLRRRPRQRRRARPPRAVAASARVRRHRRGATRPPRRGRAWRRLTWQRRSTTGSGTGTRRRGAPTRGSWRRSKRGWATRRASSTWGPGPVATSRPTARSPRLSLPPR